MGQPRTDPDEFIRQYAERIDMTETACAQQAAVARTNGQAKVVGGAPPRRLTIRLEAGTLHQCVTQAETALIEAGLHLYVRGGAIVRPVVETATGSHGHQTKIARLLPITKEHMLDLLSRVANWEKWDGRGKKWRTADPPIKIAELLLAREGEWRFPTIVGVLTTPTIRPDGTILRKEGYDPTTQLLLLAPPDMPDIAPNPTQEHARAALALLNELLTGFNFVDAASASVALSALLTAVARGGMSVVPMHVMRAPSPGSGKSYLVEIVSVLATGQRCPVISAGGREEETEKRLTAALLSAQSLISLDNVNGDLSGDLLCQAIERPVVRVRPLGISELMTIENRATLFATGNNLTLVNDMVRRVVVCSLDTNLERPELRHFDTDPIATLLADRGRYIAAVLTIIRAYVVAGRPNPCPPLASFEEWSRLIRSALVWLGCADPVATMEGSRAEDPEMAIFRDVILAWRDTIGINRQCSATEIISMAGSLSNEPSEGLRAKPAAPKLREALEHALGEQGGLTSLRLGRWLGRHKGRIVEGLKLNRIEDKHTKSALWSLVPCG